ncbi:MAG TPA: FG-GAP-like repeat-containing protein [Verrucomicrobiae bacterium]|nr:FG-GAP-like repeat-containing protein [Verrucomicrobiae bacterium]
MKTGNSLFQILIIAMAFATSVHAQTFLTNGLVADYPFNGNANDASGNGNNGNVQGATLTTNRFGVPNSAFAFDGVQSRIQIPENIFGATNPAVTISLWVTTDNGPYTGNPNILEKSGLNGAVIMVIQSNQFMFGAFLSTHALYLAGSPMISNSVTQLVGVYQQGQGVLLYTNGVLASSVTNIPNLTLWVDTSGYQLVSAIGIYDWTPAPYNGFRGVVDDVRVYTRAFSASEVQQLYQYESVQQTGPPGSNLYLLDINFAAADTNKTGFAAIGQTTNDYWNGYSFPLQTYGAVSNLKWADRSNSGINLTVLNAPGAWANNTGDGMYDPFIYPWNGGNVTGTLSNVPPGNYDFYLYGHSGNAWENSKFQITTGTNTTVWKQTQDSTLAATSTNWIEGLQYVLFRNVAILSGRTAVITCAPGDAGNAIFNGLQMISSVQTPPMITSFTPTSSLIGTNVTITGLNFSPVASNNIVYFGAVRATVTTANATNLTVTVPVGATYAPITETVNGLTAYSDQPFLPTFSGSGQVNSSSLAPAVTLPTGTGPGQVAIADLDGDGRPDLVIADSYAGDISIYQNISSNGILAFAPRLLFPMIKGAYGNPLTVVVTDLDGDGKPDIAALNSDSGLISIFRNISSPGALTTNSFGPRIDIPTLTGAQDLAVRDLNGDGRPDMVTANGANDSISIFQNQSTIGNISFAAPINFAVNSYASDVAIADLDGDGNPDLAVLLMNNSSVSVFRNLGLGGTTTTNFFAPQVIFSSAPNGRFLATGDMDGDGKPDIVTANWTTKSISVLRNLTSGPGITNNSFAAPVNFTTGGWANNVTLGDLGGVGKLDVVAASQLPSLFSVFPNISTPGSFTTSSLATRVDYASGYNPNSASIGDLNGDGRPDIVTANQYDNNIYILLNNVPTPTPPTISSEPQDAYVYAYGSASFSVTATGASSYQWMFNSSNILNATSSTLTLSSVEQSDLGQYSVAVANSYGAVTSSIANLYMYPSIVTPFTGVVTDWGQSNTLSIVAWGSGTLTFQWYDNGVVILNATNSTLTFSAIQFTNAGLYSVVVSSSLGSVTNTPAQVVVNPAGVSLGLYPGITVTGAVGYTYDIQSNPDLTNPNGWITVATLTLWQPVEFWVDVNHNAASPTNQHRFYRVLPSQ